LEHWESDQKKKQWYTYDVSTKIEVIMLRKIFKTGNSTVVSLPQEFLDQLGIQQGSDVSLELDQDNNQVVIKPANAPLKSLGIDPGFADQIAEFIDKYRPALEELARS